MAYQKFLIGTPYVLLDKVRKLRAARFQFDGFHYNQVQTGGAMNGSRVMAWRFIHVCRWDTPRVYSYNYIPCQAALRALAPPKTGQRSGVFLQPPVHKLDDQPSGAVVVKAHNVEA